MQCGIPDLEVVELAGSSPLLEAMFDTHEISRSRGGHGEADELRFNGDADGENLGGRGFNEAGWRFVSGRSEWIARSEKSAPTNVTHKEALGLKPRERQAEGAT